MKSEDELLDSLGSGCEEDGESGVRSRFGCDGGFVRLSVGRVCWSFVGHVKGLLHV